MSRRGNNEGSIYRRKDGRWASTINLGWQDGKLRRKTFYGRTRQEVQGKLTDALHTLHQGWPIITERQTVGNFIERWLEDSVKPSVRPKTYVSYSQIARLYLLPYLGRISLEKLTPQQLQSFLNKRVADGLSPRTVQYTHAVLRRALGQAMKWGLISRNVALLVDLPKMSNHEVEPLTLEQVKVFLKEISSDRLEALYLVATGVGLRKGELLGLRWEDVDLNAGRLRVRVALQRIEGTLQLVELKTRRSRRSVALPQLAVRSLRFHQVHQMEERVAAGDIWQESGLVFTTAIGTPLEPRNVTRHFHNALEKAGLPRQRFYDLRHTCASLLLAQGIQPRVLMEILGHSQISLTMNTYAHVMPQLERDAADKMNAALTP